MTVVLAGGPVETDRQALALVSLRRAVADLDLVASRHEIGPQRRVVAEAFGRAVARLYAGGRLPADGEVRAVLAACGTGAARLVPLEWAREHFVHQFWTREFVDALAARLRTLALEPVVEVGAGRGDLARWLRERGIPVVATDDGSWLDGRLGWPLGLPPDVERAGYVEALARHRPAAILCSWMPLGEDWTPAFRACPAARAYLLIGEGPGGCTGTPASFGAPPPWRRATLPDLARWGLTRNADRDYVASVYQFTRDD